MKRLIILFTFCSLQSDAQAQYGLPNSSFEQWQLTSTGDSALGWSSSNAIVIPPVKSLYSTTDAYSGGYAAHVVTAPFGFVQYSTIGILANGKAAFTYGGGGSEVNTAYSSGGGTPISYKPTELRGYYKYGAAQSDHGLAIVLLSKYNSLKKKRDTIALGTTNLTIQHTYTPLIGRPSCKQHLLQKKNS